MPYQAVTIAHIVNRLNVSHFLPAIQREFVWEPSKIVKLFDSLMRGYPISTFLFWELKPASRSLWDIYRFIEFFDAYAPHNEPASQTGVQQLMLVLDGQQRLTSLLIGLKGSYRIKKKHRRRDRPDAWEENTLYLDLFKDPTQEPEDGEMGLRYGFEFHPNAPVNDSDHHWFKVGEILNFDSEDQFDQFNFDARHALPNSVQLGQQRAFENNLNRLYRVVWRDDVISYYTEHNQEFDRVLDIFVRANAGGTKLSKSDLLLSMATARWGDINARKEIFEFVDRLNKDLTGKNAFDQDFIMKSCLVLTDLEVVYKVQNFNRDNLSLIQRKWPEIKQAIERGVDLVNSFGIDRENLTSTNALIPIIYYLFKNPGRTLRTSERSDVSIAGSIRSWLLMALLKGAFGRASDNLLRGIREAIMTSPAGAGFPVDAINERIRRTGLSPAFDDQAVDEILGLTYGGQQTFLALSLLYDYNGWATTQHHQDHIFPRSLFRTEQPDFSRLSADQQARYLELMNSFGNLELLTAEENLEKSNKDFQTWLRTRDADFRRRHLIPSDDALLPFDRFKEFVTAREELIRQRLRQLFVP